MTRQLLSRIEVLSSTPREWDNARRFFASDAFMPQRLPLPRPRRLTRLRRALPMALASLLCAAPGVALAAPPIMVVHAERVELSHPRQPSRPLPDAALDELRLEAFGRQFDLTLQPNDRLSPALEHSALQLYRGRLRDTPGSWARLSWHDGHWQGLLWDGATLYAIEPMEHLTAALTGRPLAGAQADTEGTAMFRLDDTLLPVGIDCSATNMPATEGRTGAQAYRALMDELQGAAPLAVGANRQLQVSVLADPALIAIHGTETRARDAILRRLNNVDGIFSEQLGIEIRATLIETTTQLPATTSPGELLKAVAQLRRASPSLHARGLTHLFTGRDLDGDIVGNAYVGTLCDVETSAGLTQARGGDAQLWHESLVAAHEIGHTFGAVHDGEGACSATPANQYLMAPDTAGTPVFSSCSLTMMQAKLSAAACLSPLSAADVALDDSLGTLHAPMGRSFDWQVIVRNIGGLHAAQPQLEIQLPPSVQVEAASVVGGSCTSGAGVISCQLADIAGNSAHTVQMRLRAEQAGVYPTRARVTVSNDASLANNFAEGTLRITAEADLGLRIDGPDTAPAGEAFALHFIASTASPGQVEDATLHITLPTTTIQASMTLAGAHCERTLARLDCQLPTLTANSPLTGQLQLRTNDLGPLQVHAELSSSLFDPVPADNSASMTLTVSSASTVSATTSPRRGGGGSMQAAWLAALAGLLAFTRRRA